MSFIREVPALQIVLLKLIANQPLKSVTEKGCRRLLEALDKGCFEGQDIVQILVKYITDAGRMSDDAVPAFIFNRRRKISLSNSKVSGKYLLKAISQSRDTLVNLDVSGCFQMDAGIMEQVWQSCKQITVLDLRSCRKTTDRLLEVLCSSADIRLTSLDIGGNYNISDDGVRSFLNAYHSIENLRTLNLSGLKIRDDTVLLLARRCTSLISLGLGYLDLRDSTYLELFRTLGHQLEVLNLSWASTVAPVFHPVPTPEFLIDSLVSYCPALAEVDLTGNKLIYAPHILDLIERKAALLADSMNDNARALEVVIVKFIGSPRATMENSVKVLYPNLKIVC